MFLQLFTLKFLCKLVDSTKSYAREQKGMFFLNTVYISICAVQYWHRRQVVDTRVRPLSSSVAQTVVMLISLVD